MPGIGGRPCPVAAQLCWCCGWFPGQIPKGSFLWPRDDAAVVGGNVLTSQRLCDVILKAFGACADSQV